MRYQYGIRLTIAYDGKNFSGWQYQPTQRTVQGEIEKVLEKMKTPFSLIRGASRTDAGVHAHGNVASFATDRDLDERSWRLAFNTQLDDDISILKVEKVDPKYDPRRDSKGKLYRYLIQVGKSRDPLLRHVAWYVGPAFSRRDRRAGKPKEATTFLDVEAMQKAADKMVGVHDFSAFQAANDHRDEAVRNMKSIRVIPHYFGLDNVVAIEVEGTAFVKNMVRIMVGTLVDVGRQHQKPEWIDELFEKKDRREAGPTAPAHGLALVKVYLGRIADLKSL